MSAGVADLGVDVEVWRRSDVGRGMDGIACRGVYAGASVKSENGPGLKLT